MAINLNNLFNSINKNSKMGDFQDLDHLDGVSISTSSANLYSKKRDDVVLFYFRNGATFASVYTQSKLISENIKWNLKINKKKVSALLINTRNANAFTGKKGYKGIKILAEDISLHLSERQKKTNKILKKLNLMIFFLLQQGLLVNRSQFKKLKLVFQN